MADKSLKALKFMVIAMGVFLIGGIILLFSLIYQRQQKSPAREVPPMFTNMVNKGDCKGGDLNIEDKGLIESVQVNGDNVTLFLAGVEDDESQKILIIDKCSNQVTNRIILK